MVPHRRIDDAGGHAVDVDAVFDQPEPRRLGEADHGRLRGAVDAHQRLAAPPGLARDVDDPPAPALRHHLPGHGLQREQQALHVDGKDGVVAFLGDLEDGGEIEGRGVVDEDIDAADQPDGFADEMVDRGHVGDLERDRDGAVAELVGQRAGLRSQPVGDDDPRAFGGIAPADGGADAAGAAGHDRHLVPELHAVLPGCRLAIPSRVRKMAASPAARFGELSCSCRNFALSA